MYGFLRAFFIYVIIFITFFISYLFFRFTSILNLNKKEEINREFFSNLFKILFYLVFWIDINIFINQTIDLRIKKYIFVCNHISYLDIFVLIFLSSKFKNNHLCKFVGMEKINDWIIIGYVIKEMGMIPIKLLQASKDINKYCEESKIKFKKKCIEEINKGYSLFIFPEGRLNKNPSILNNIHSGAYYFSNLTNTPIKFIGLKNINKIWKMSSHPSGYGSIDVKIFDEDYYFSNSANFKNEFKKKIEFWINN